jgi:hypothetical protein
MRVTHPSTIHAAQLPRADFYGDWIATVTVVDVVPLNEIETATESPLGRCLGSER